MQAYFADLDRLDLLVHNAGLTRDALLLKMDPVDFQALLDVHLKGAFLCAQAPHQLESVHKGEHHIQQGHGRHGARLDQAHALTAIDGVQHVVAFPLQHEAQQVGDVIVVFNDQRGGTGNSVHNKRSSTSTAKKPSAARTVHFRITSPQVR